MDELLAGTLDATRELAARALADYSLNHAALPAALHARGVDDASVLPHYPYRDDALLYWRVIKRWVHDYVAHLLPLVAGRLSRTPSSRKWCRELGHAGRVAGFRDGAVITTRTALVDALTSVIFTASVQHAAVNYPQYDHMAYTPSMPLAGFAPAPVGVHGLNEQDYLELLPPQRSALGQLNILYLLGSVRHTTLGEYGDGTLCDPCHPEADERLQSPPGPGRGSRQRSQS